MKLMKVLTAAALGLAGTAMAQQTKPAETGPEKIRTTVRIEKARLEESGVAAEIPPQEGNVFRWRAAAGVPQDVLIGQALPDVLAFVAPVEMEKAAFLGVTTSPVTPALREQLKLQKGMGLVIDHIEPESPAAKAGLKRYDIVQKLNDQLLVNSHQLQVLVRTHKAGDKVDLTIIREGKATVMAAALVEKEMPVLSDSSPWGATPDVINLNTAGAVPGVRAARVALPPGGHGGVAMVTTTVADRAAVFADGQTRLMFNVGKDGVTTLTATDNEGKEIFKGPIDTPEQRKALPKELAEKLEQPAVKRLIETLKADRPGMFNIDLNVDGPGKK